MPKGYKEAYSRHDGAAHPGRDGGRKSADVKQSKARAGRVGTAADISAFDGASRAPGKPPRLQSGRTGTMDALARGKDAGGRDNMKAGGAKKRSDGMHVPQTGSAKFLPDSVHAGDGLSTPKAAAKSPR